MQSWLSDLNLVNEELCFVMNSDLESYAKTSGPFTCLGAPSIIVACTHSLPTVNFTFLVNMRQDCIGTIAKGGISVFELCI